MSTTASTLHEVPSFHTHSLPLAVVRALVVMTLWAALAAGFLAQVWRAPAPPTEDASEATTPAPPTPAPPAPRARPAGVSS